MLKEFFILCTIIFILILIFCDKDETYDPNSYNYDRENPNFLQHGKIIAGAVYSDYPNRIPGLGWIL